MFERRMLRNLDWVLLVVTLLLIGLGMVSIFSATRTNTDLTDGDPGYFVKRQMLWALIGLLAMGFLIYIDYQYLGRAWRSLYAINLLLLLAVLQFGHSTGGAMRWIGIGSFRLQPSEFAKLVLIITLATYIYSHSDQIRRLRIVSISFLHIALPALLVFLQPDLGTALVIIGLWIALLFVGNARLWQLGAFALAGICLAAGAWHFDLLKDYQKQRLTIFLDPSQDPLGAGYHIIQSKIAIGSGQITGKGLFQGTQSQLHYIPAQHTDFIFTVPAEEGGLIWAGLLILLYLLLIWRGIRVAERARDKFGRLLATGALAVLGFHIVHNIGMTMKLLPVTGLPLPFLSYGGSNLLVSMAAVGILLSVSIRRQKILF